MKFTPKRFSPEELERRKARLMAVRHLGPQAMIRKHQKRRVDKEAWAAHVKAQAALGIFVPVADFE